LIFIRYSVGSKPCYSDIPLPEAGIKLAEISRWPYMKLSEYPPWLDMDMSEYPMGHTISICPTIPVGQLSRCLNIWLARYLTV
jgi:hypothetical protein